MGLHFGRRLRAGSGGAPQDKGPAGGETAKVLKIGTDAAFPPFEMYQKETRAYSGYDIELIRAVAQNMGYSDIEIVDSDMKSLLKDLNDKKFDVAVRCLAATDNRRTTVDFTDPYLMGGYTVVVSAKYDGDTGKDMLAGKKIAAEKDASVMHTLKDMHYMDLVEETTTLNAIRDVADGEADAAVMSKFTAAFYIANGYGDKVKAYPGPFEGKDVPVAFAVRKDDSNFHAKLNAALGEFRRTTNAKQLEKSYFGEVLSRI